MLKSTVQEVRGAVKRARVRRSRQALALSRILETNTVYVHIPKCGGKSVVHDIYDVSEHMWFGHAKIGFYHTLLGPRRFQAAFKFAFVRDPLTRCLSGFEFRKRGGFDLPVDQAMQPEIDGLTFEQFVLGGKLAELARTDIVFKPQLPLLLLPNGEIGVDRVCRFERFSDEMTALPLNISGGSPSHRNAAPRKPRTDPSDAVKAKIAEVYERDYKFIADLPGSGLTV